MWIILCYGFCRLDECVIEGDCASDGPHGSQSRQRQGMFQYCTAILSADERINDWDCAWWDMGCVGFRECASSPLTALQSLAQKSCQNQYNVLRIGRNGDRRADMATVVHELHCNL